MIIHFNKRILSHITKPVILAAFVSLILIPVCFCASDQDYNDDSKNEIENLILPEGSEDFTRRQAVSTSPKNYIEKGSENTVTESHFGSSTLNFDEVLSNVTEEDKAVSTPSTNEPDDHLGYPYIKPAYLKVRAGGEARLVCSVTSSSSVVIWWLHDNKIITLGLTYSNATQFPGIRVYNSLLRIRPVFKSRKGFYRCIVTAEDQRKMVEAKALLDVIDAAKLGESCMSDMECAAVGSTCEGGFCKCRDDYPIAVNQPVQKCIERNSYHKYSVRSFCTNTEECLNITENTVCYDNVCQCKDNYIYFSPHVKCYKRAYLFDQCYVDIQCIIPMSWCSYAQVCTCKMGYHHVRGSCIWIDQRNLKTQEVYKAAMVAAVCFLVAVLGLFVVFIMRKTFCHTPVPPTRCPRSSSRPSTRAHSHDVFTIPSEMAAMRAVDKPPTYDEVMRAMQEYYGRPPPAYPDEDTAIMMRHPLVVTLPITVADSSLTTEPSCMLPETVPPNVESTNRESTEEDETSKQEETTTSDPAVIEITETSEVLRRSASPLMETESQPSTTNGSNENLESANRKEVYDNPTFVIDT